MTMVVSSSNATTVDTQSPPAPASIHTPSMFNGNNNNNSNSNKKESIAVVPTTTTAISSSAPPSRSYSVTAPTELQRSVQRQYEQQLLQQQRSSSSSSSSSTDIPWWQYYYQMYHYHPPAGRKPTVFGPYLLLHTLGEGEFGKVKLGIHIESGQEVAIKLIKKDHIDSSSRMTKVEREISVLRTVCHPYIVKLYDVIETEKYIGIILQCASGGELFEYILAHRYLKERDACRLFAQLISGVHYMHQKHIVHRDLKLENLLLDRDRNIIITDFGFANQFTSAKNDLMATSCGSPCYAAPELVVSEGMYVGSAVDIWSCGVILYAMLCGYLPFDDDPANPEGDNINLLYKYILNTQLAFPDYVSDDAKDLLQKMLVPDPAKRCTMQIIMEHNWLRPHRYLFDKNTKELEVQAMQQADLPTIRQQQQQQQQQQPTAAGTTTHPNTTTKQQQQKKEGDTVQPTGLKVDDDPLLNIPQEISASSSDNNNEQEDQTVPTITTSTPLLAATTTTTITTTEMAAQSMEVDSDNARVPKENRDSSIMIMSNDEENVHVSPSTPSPQHISSLSNKQKEQENDNELVQQQHKDECIVKGTMTATDLASTSAPDISALELPASMHTESSESTAEKISDISDTNKEGVKKQEETTYATMEETPVESKSNTSMDITSSSTTSTTPASSSSTSPMATHPNGGSILQAKFLSSIQRQNQQQQESTSALLTAPYPEQQALMSMSTPQMPTSNTHPNISIITPPPTTNNRRQRSPSSAVSPQPLKHHHPDNKENTTRGTRRKALSLLVNSMTDHLQLDNHNNHNSRQQQQQNGKKSTTMSFTRTTNNNKHGTRERAQSVLTSSTSHQQRYSGLKRVVVGKDRTSSSSAAGDALPRSSMHVMPSVSEQTVIHDKDKHKSAGKKLMEWFKKKPLSTRHGDMMFTDRPLSSLQRAMPLGKSYAVDFNDNKLRTHHGAVDQEALTSGSPVDVLVEVKQALLSMGMDVKKDGEYKLKCIRQRRKRPSSHESTTTTTTTSSSSSHSRTDKKRRMSTSAPFRKLLRRSGVNQTTVPFTHATNASTATTATTATTTNNNHEVNPHGNDMGTTTSPSLQIGETVYGDPVVDPGEEVRFSVELCKIKNLPGLYIVDIRRMRGNVWAYKFLYHTLLDTLNLSGKGGYIKTPTATTAATTTTATTMNHHEQKSLEQGGTTTGGGISTTESSTSTSSSSASSSSTTRKNMNRHSCASSGGSSSMLEDVKEEE